MFDRRRRPLVATTRLGRGAWPLAGALLLEVLAASLSIVGLVEGSGWWWGLVGIAALLLALPAALRTAGVRPWAASVIDLLVFAALVDLLYGGGRALLGVIPTPASVAHVRGLFVQAFQAIQEQGVPAEPLPELLFFVVVFGGVLAILLDLLAVTLRVPAATALALLAVLAVPAVLQPDGLTLLALGASAVAWLAVLVADGRVRLGARGGGAVALAVGGSALVVALVVSATAPGFVRVGRQASDAGALTIGNSVDPLIDLARDLKRPDATPVLSFSTAAKTPGYLQLTTLDVFTGTIWRHQSSPGRPLVGGTGVSSPPGLDLGAGIRATPYSTKVSVDSLVSSWIPAPYPAASVSGAPRSSGYEANDLTISSGDTRLSGRGYTVKSLDVQPTRAQLDAVPAIDPAQLPVPILRDLYLPGQVPAIITSTARSVAAGADSSSEIAEAIALQQYFQDPDNGFSYSTDTPDSVAGTSLGVVAAFLREKEGYCIHYATAMAVMARALGIPSRIAIGYLPGAAVSTKGRQTTYEVDSTDLHAWPQLYFPGVGWLSFEPTVSRGAAPAYTIPQVDLGGVTSAPAVTSTPTTQATSGADAPQLSDEGANAGTSPTSTPSRAPLSYGVLLLLVVLAGPAIARQLIRRSRLRRLRDDGGPPELAWAELRDTARDLGFATSATETPRAFASRLREGWHPSHEQQAELDAILALVELAEYGRASGGTRRFELVDQTARVTDALRATRPGGARLLAVIAPMSLVAVFGDRQRSGARSLI